RPGSRVPMLNESNQRCHAMRVCPRIGPPRGDHVSPRAGIGGATFSFQALDLRRDHDLHDTTMTTCSHLLSHDVMPAAIARPGSGRRAFAGGAWNVVSVTDGTQGRDRGIGATGMRRRTQGGSKDGSIGTGRTRAHRPR
ncbi:MAG TPA: hypothetical protein VFV33_19070, partial [Gemmatimonadaceae bacterium]|nr:hypothetical protein [Gemmatimonadaceae bacterium]